MWVRGFSGTTRRTGQDHPCHLLPPPRWICEFWAGGSLAQRSGTLLGAHWPSAFRISLACTRPQISQLPAPTSGRRMAVNVGRGAAAAPCLVPHPVYTPSLGLQTPSSSPCQSRVQGRQTLLPAPAHRILLITRIGPAMTGHTSTEQA